MTLTPEHNMLTVVTDDDMLVIVRKMFPFVGETALRTSLKLFRDACVKHNVVLLQATPDDSATIRQRQAIGWSDDRP